MTCSAATCASLHRAALLFRVKDRNNSVCKDSLNLLTHFTLKIHTKLVDFSSKTHVYDHGSRLALLCQKALVTQACTDAREGLGPGEQHGQMLNFVSKTMCNTTLCTVTKTNMFT